MARRLYMVLAGLLAATANLAPAQQSLPQAGAAERTTTAQDIENARKIADASHAEVGRILALRATGLAWPKIAEIYGVSWRSGVDLGDLQPLAPRPEQKPPKPAKRSRPKARLRDAAGKKPAGRLKYIDGYLDGGALSTVAQSQAYAPAGPPPLAAPATGQVTISVGSTTLTIAVPPGVAVSTAAIEPPRPSTTTTPLIPGRTLNATGAAPNTGLATPGGIAPPPALNVGAPNPDGTTSPPQVSPTP